MKIRLYISVVTIYNECKIKEIKTCIAVEIELLNSCYVVYEI